MIGEVFPTPDTLALFHLGDATDSSGNGRDLSNSGNVTFLDAGFNRAAYFGDPNIGYLYSEDLLGLPDLEQEFTLIGAINPTTLSTSSSSANVIFELSDYVGCRSLKLSAYYSTTSGVTLRLTNSGNVFSGATRLDLRNKWTWWAVVNHQSSADLYVGGRYLITVTPPPEPLTDWHGFCLGQGLDSSYPWRGYMDETVLVIGSIPSGDLARWSSWTVGWLDFGI